MTSRRATYGNLRLLWCSTYATRISSIQDQAMHMLLRIETATCSFCRNPTPRFKCATRGLFGMETLPPDIE